MSPGRLTGTLDINAYILFPSLYHSRAEADMLLSNFLTDDEECLWFDGVFAPALVASVPRHALQEAPMSWHAAVANSLASSYETGAQERPTANHGRQQLLLVHLEAQYLQQLWQGVQQRIQDSEAFSPFRGCRLFFNGRDFKLHSPCSSWADLDTSWSQTWSQMVDEAHVNGQQYWVDIARQITPPDGLLTGDPIDPTTQEPG